MVFFDNLLQSLAEITYKGTADTTGVHLIHLDAGVLQEATVNTDLAKFVLDKDKLFALICFLDEFLNEGGFTGA